MTHREVATRVLKLLAEEAGKAGTLSHRMSRDEIYKALPDVEPKQIDLAIDYLDERSLIKATRYLAGYHVRITASGLDAAQQA